MTSTQNHAFIRGQSCASLDWGKVKYFQPKEFPLGELDFLNRYVIEELDKVREALGTPLIPSPAPGAVVRFDAVDELGWPTSWHASCEKRKLGQAIDVFVPQAENLHLAEVIAKIFGATRFRGVGFYFDAHLGGKPTFMMHLDLRHVPLFFFCPKDISRRYVYPHLEKDFLSWLEKEWEDFFFAQDLEKKDGEKS